MVISCKDETTEVKNSKPITSEIPVYNFKELEPLLYSETTEIQIVNFWAMWCAPCVKELPFLQDYASSHKDIKLTLVSMDFVKDIDTKLKPFLQKHNITDEVVLLNDPDANTWINKVNPEWSGAIPYTIIFNKDKRVFYERSFESVEDLETEIRKNFNN